MEEEKTKEVIVEKKPRTGYGRLLAVVLLALIVLALIGAKFYFDNASQPNPITQTIPSISVSPTVSISTSQKAPTTLTPTPTPTNVFSFGFKKGFYLPYKITIQPGWRAIPSTNNTDTRMNYIVDKYMPDGSYYSMTLSEDLSFSSQKCTYPGETATGTDRAFKNFAEIEAGVNTFRRGVVNIGDNIQMLCQKQISGYEAPTQFGNILINFPKTNINADIVIEMDKILSSIRPTQ